MAAPSTIDATPSPIEQFVRWFDEAVRGGEHEPEVMALGTTTADGHPSVRYVLYRGLSEGSPRFFTNFESRKASELGVVPRAAVAFYWPIVGRQVRIEGRIERVTDAESDEYFASRPRGHRLAALSSAQSRPVDRAQLLARYAALEVQYEGRDVPRPAYWGGYRLVPDRVEFWTRRENRLHERTLHVFTDGRWEAQFLSP